MRVELSDGELDVLLSVSKGHPNKVIAKNRGVTEQTIKTMMSHIFKKLNAVDRTSAVVIAIKKGYIEIGGIEEF